MFELILTQRRLTSQHNWLISWPHLRSVFAQLIGSLTESPCSVDHVVNNHDVATLKEKWIYEINSKQKRRKKPQKRTDEKTDFNSPNDIHPLYFVRSMSL